MPRTTGRYQLSITAGEEVRAFVPDPLPPADPPLALDRDLSGRLQQAERALGRLALAGEMVPSLDWFLYAFQRKEAVLSSQIEGTQATLVDLLRAEADPTAAADADVAEVSNTLDALRFAREQLAAPSGLPLSLRLLNDCHARLMRGARGADEAPGQVRRTQNWVGGTRPATAAFVPPPPQRLPDLLAALERYLHDADELPPLVRVGLAHVQFETIHPYLDGNGRIGRLLITLLLEHWQLLPQPLLYLSLYFKRHRDEYYRRLGAVRTEGDWEGWTRFFLEGVAALSEEAVAAARELFAIVTADRERALTSQGTSLAALRLFETLPRNPIVTVASTMRLLSTTKPTAGRAIDALVDAGVLVETTGRRRDRSFSYEKYLNLLRRGTELEAR